MPHIKVNGITINALASGEELVRIGEISESFGGGLRRSVRSLKSAYTFTSALYVAAEARALRAWLEGRGHVIAADSDLTTSRGMIETVGVGVVGATGKHGVAVTFPGGGYAQWEALPDVASAPWSAAMWIEISATWVHHLFINNGSTTTTYVNGGLDGGFTPADVVARVGGNNRALRVGDLNSGGTLVAFDDIVIWDFQVPAAWAPLIFAFHDAQAWPLLPDLFADGDAIQDVGATGGMTVLGQAGGATNQYIRSGSSLVLAQAFDFSLTEAQSDS